MIRLFFDTETTGLIKRKKVWVAGKPQWNNDPIWQQTAEIIQLAFILEVDGKIEKKQNLYFCPKNGIPEETTKVHGITPEMVEWSPYISSFFSEFIEMTKTADEIVGHNVTFDMDMIYLELNRHFYQDEKVKKWKATNYKKIRDTMLASIEYCNLPWKYGKKYPKLTELYDKLFNREFNAHNALDDIEATIECYYELKSLDLI